MAQPSGSPSNYDGSQRHPTGELRLARDVLTFHIAEEEYGIGIEHIREIIKHRLVTEVPRVPGFVAGIIAVRGQVMPVLDLRQRLRMRAASLSAKSRILIVSRPAASNENVSEEERERFGLVVDRVNEVVRIHEVDIEPPTVLSGKESDFVEGIGRIRAEVDESARREARFGPGMITTEPQRIIILLDLVKVLSFEVMRSGRMF
ncbi:MAG TPA: chemotaxis protein CheW [Pseudomonadota bacterium]|jgi:purine-binding chemotaxis protein CheW|nr:chemotaxis protein CheW [Pseudomonadota bacterium]HND09037.1 chemotaxis protein CheW [Pseudomonadota bacterium]HNI61560.1 chemotaxis protein CheW [Pseudomonadota bacterium]HNK44855.1 chemotaxis protein CheW [Pseudomonadota bacterium]HNN49805.1 chemotaxis protein CheW [Pseudomonadota bacterium]